MMQLVGFLASAAAAFAIGVVAVLVGTGRPRLSIAVGLLLVTAVTILSTFLGLRPRATATGALFGCLVFTAALVFMDWSVGMPATAPLTAAAFFDYLALYRQPPAIIGVLTPLLVTVAALAAGRALCRLAGLART